jgi:type I restriction enzyme S subunit
MSAQRKSIDGWEDKNLGSLCSLINGFPFKPDDWGPDGKPIIRIQNLNGGNDYNHFDGKIDPKYEVDPGTMLFAWSGNRGTSFGPYVWSGPTGLLNQHIFKVIPSEGIHREWFFYALDEVKERVERDAHGASGLVHVRKSDLVKYPIAFPKDPTEQTKIAEILSTVDRAIEQTEALIAKQQSLKTGLMQDLLTRGIDQHGNLRSEQTHKFKDSPLGRIPVEWEVVTLNQVVDELITYGIVQAGPHIEDGVPYIRTGDMSGDFIEVDRLLRTSFKLAKAYKRSEVHEGDIVFALRATVGKVMPVDASLHGANLTQGTAKISPKKGIASAYLIQALRTSKVQDQIRLCEKGTTFMEITLTDLRQILVAMPKEESEQQAIAEGLDGSDASAAKYYKSLHKLRSLKTALIQDLLTGRKRVTALLDGKEASA